MTSASTTPGAEGVGAGQGVGAGGGARGEYDAAPGDTGGPPCGGDVLGDEEAQGAGAAGDDVRAGTGRTRTPRAGGGLTPARRDGPGPPLLLRTWGPPSVPSSATTASASGRPGATASTPGATDGCSRRTVRAKAAIAGWAGDGAGSGWTYR